MPTLDAARDIAIDVMKVESEDELADLLRLACDRMGCDYYALTHHIDFLAAPDRGVRLHNYPGEWERWFDEHGLGLSDPVHRASQRTTAAFLWRQMSRFVPPRAQDEKILGQARRHGIRDGLTIPAHLPGDAHGSVSFGWSDGRPAIEHLPFAAMIGAFAFEAARQLSGKVPEEQRPRLTDRQRECVLWVARGKSDWAIGRILDLRPGTVVEHLRNARGRYDAPSRTVLTVRALWDGSITFADIASR